MHGVPLLINITLALVVAFFGGMVAKRIGFPTIVGYLLAGIIIGPFTPGFVGDIETIQQLAELGVIFLMFGVGLHFSFGQLWRVRNVAVPGALLQTALATVLGILLTRIWGWNLTSGIVLGLSISVASTVVLLRGLEDNKLLNTPHGQAAVGWLVMEDLLSVFILVLMPALASTGESFDWGNLAITLLKAAAFIAIMFFAGVRFIPWILERAAQTRSRELFILVVLAITLGTAMGASELFGVSLALGAFVAGAIISQSHLSHQVGADVFSFREAFSVLFFVSVGMLVNPAFLLEHFGEVALLTLLVIVGKGLIVLLLGLIFPWPPRTSMVIAIGLSQIGEFSFILGQGGLSQGMLDTGQYSLILATSLISITLNPFMYRLLPGMEKFLQGIPAFHKKFEIEAPAYEPDEEQLKDHVVIVGYGRVGKHLVDVLQLLSVPHLVIESDMERIELLNERKVLTLFGDASNSEVINHAHLERARVLVITVPDATATAMVVTRARDIAPELSIVARSTSTEGVRILADLGANFVVQPELEGGLEMVHHTLLRLGFPLRQVNQYAEAVRRDHYDIEVLSDDEHRTLHDLLFASKNIELYWVTVEENSPLVGRTLAESNIRSVTGASVVTLMRNGEVAANPKSGTVFEAGDRIGLIGDEQQIAAAQALVAGPTPPSPRVEPVETPPSISAG